MLLDDEDRRVVPARFTLPAFSIATSSDGAGHGLRRARGVALGVILTEFSHHPMTYPPRSACDRAGSVLASWHASDLVRCDLLRHGDGAGEDVRRHRGEAGRLPPRA